VKTLASIVLSALIVVAFAGFVATHAVHSNVVAESYFADALAKNRVFDRLYDQLKVGQVPVTAEQMHAMSDQLIGHLVAHFRDDAPLDLTFDTGHEHLGLGPEATGAIGEKLATLEKLNHAAAWVSIVAGIGIVLAILVLVVIHRRARPIAAWLGVAFVAAGGATIAAWLVAEGRVEDQLEQLAARGSPALRGVLGDVLDTALASLSRSIWIPSIGALIVGAVMLGTATRLRRA
jgi:hypothetical protein